MRDIMEACAESLMCAGVEMFWLNRKLRIIRNMFSVTVMIKTEKMMVKMMMVRMMMMVMMMREGWDGHAKTDDRKKPPVLVLDQEENEKLPNRRSISGMRQRAHKKG